MSIMIAVDILGCTGSTEERAALLHKTIQLAAELKSTMGNMFSFAAVMNALEMAQVRGCCLRPHGLGSAPFLNTPSPHGPPIGVGGGGPCPGRGVGPHPLGSKQGRERAIPSVEQTAQSCRDVIVCRRLGFLFCAGLCS